MFVNKICWGTYYIYLFILVNLILSFAVSSKLPSQKTPRNARVQIKCFTNPLFWPATSMWGWASNCWTKYVTLRLHPHSHLPLTPEWPQPRLLMTTKAWRKMFRWGYPLGLREIRKRLLLKLTVSWHFLLEHLVCTVCTVWNCNVICNLHPRVFCVLYFIGHRETFVSW